jgi:acyl carrier protein
MTREDVDREVREVFATVLDRRIEPGTDVVRSEEPEWDSLKHVDLMFSVEERFDLQFPEEDLAKMSRLSQVVDEVMKSLEARNLS